MTMIVYAFLLIVSVLIASASAGTLVIGAWAWLADRRGAVTLRRRTWTETMGLAAVWLGMTVPGIVACVTMLAARM